MEVVKVLKVQDIMEENVPYATVPGTREEVLSIMRESGTTFLPVVKKGRIGAHKGLR